jgi:hypothetical protein
MYDRDFAARAGASPMEQVPPWVRQMVAVIMTVSAALLYALVLGIAIYRTITEPNPAFSTTMSRAAAVLSGMVGAVVTAGFARSNSGVSVQVAGIRRDLVGAPVHWIKRNFFGLARTLGLPLLPELVLWTEPAPGTVPGVPESDSPSYEVDEPTVNRGSLAVSMLYFGVYFLVGLASFVTSIALEEVPELLSNASWVWVGSLVSTTYSFFSMNGDTPVV